MSEKITSIEYIRGVAMLGVVGIHTGAHSLSNPHVNIHLFALLEIASRFSVPIFFFVSAFGLFLHHDLAEPFDYRRYFQRRCRTVLIPYLVWSTMYLLWQCIISGHWLWSPLQLCEQYLFGLASFHIYFLVILIWFYALMPLWRAVLPGILAHPLRNLAVILVLQIIFNYYSSYHLHANLSNYYFNAALKYRLNYLPLHYTFIFLLGAVSALRYSDFSNFLRQYRTKINLFFLLTLSGMLAAYYWLLLVDRYTPVEAVCTVHQLNPIGVLYTMAAALFFMSLFTHYRPSRLIALFLGSLSRYSYPIYLVHPLFMYYLIGVLAKLNLVLTAPVVIVFYCATIALSLVFGILLKKAAGPLPLLGMLLTGTYPAAQTKPGRSL